VGGELRSAEQDEPVQPIIPLGAKGQLQGVHWQVVGFQHRMGVEPGDDEHFGWSEYLLYNQKRGFAFLVDSEEGWSMVRPTTGAPQLAASGRSATYLGTTYQLKYHYDAETTYVLGEFYWQVERGQKTSNRDFASSKGLLSMEQSRNESPGRRATSWPATPWPRPSSSKTRKTCCSATTPAPSWPSRAWAAAPSS
jgi:hypothetical protein